MSGHHRERVHNTRHESQGTGKGQGDRKGSRDRSGVGGRVSEQSEGVEIVGIRRKRGKKGDIIARREQEQGKGVGATGGSGDCRNKAEKGEKG